MVSPDASGHLFLAAPAGAPARADHRLRIISALAPGPDQWAADEAVSWGTSCSVRSRSTGTSTWRTSPSRRASSRRRARPPMISLRPMLGASQAAYQRLLAAATAVFELDGRVVRTEPGVRQPDSRSYEAAGRAMLNQSDLLIAVWDGQPGHGPGGTGQVVDEALRRGVPVVWIPWGRPCDWQLRLPAWRLAHAPGSTPRQGHRPHDACAGVAASARRTRTPRTGREDLREEYFAEQQKRGNPLHGCWGLLRNLVCAEFLHGERDGRNSSR